MPKFSIIVPVFKAEKYIKRCVDSILAQDNQDWELILVDDGSPDRSGEMCDGYCDQDKCIRVFHKSNGGVSSARNLGLEKAVGDWVLFVDADDTMEHQALSTIAEVVERNSIDLVLYSINEVTCKKNIFRHQYPLTPNSIYDRQDVEQQMLPFACQSSSFVNSPCNKVYRRGIIEKNQIRFQMRVMGEDWLFNVEYLQCINSAIYIDISLYNYMRNGESATSRYIPEQFQLWTENWDTKVGLIKKYHLDVDVEQMMREMILKTFYFVRQVMRCEITPDKNPRLLHDILHSSYLAVWLSATPRSIYDIRANLYLRIKRLFL